ncbi:acyltransferase family protein [Aerosakkonema funiforme]|uniref:acyltransferase family protein n=1 Tax=Aerosakkonema funiforme TaxID=1246630 RepID=UPI0035B6D54D
MGFLRFILAVSVLIFHSHPIAGIKLVGGQIAVQSFFIISGFYMALILTEKYVGKGYYKAFMKSRLVRLFPAYWAVILVIAMFSLLHSYLLGGGLFLQSWMANWQSVNIFSKIYLLFTNLFIFGQDIVMFLQLHQPDGWLSFTSNFTQSQPQVHTFLLIPQAWSLSIELLFYCIAPLLVRQSSFVIVILISLSLLLRITLYSVGLNYDPWTYRFFPTELAFFLCGIISYRIYSKFKNHNFQRQNLLYLTLFVYGLTILFPFMPGVVIKQWLYYIMIMVSIPFMFIYTQRSRVDRLLGELSYPIYIAHVFVVVLIERIVLSTFLKKVLQGQQDLILNNFLGIAALFLTTLLSILLIKLLVEPIEAYRQSIAKRLLEKQSQQ